jgi:hypothetical protein
VLPWQTGVLPVISPGCEGTPLSTTTDSVWAGLLPHALFAVTVILPLTVPTVTVMLFVVELPVHVDGKVHV